MRIHHIQVTTAPEQEAACRAFYGEVLGLEEIIKPQPLRARGGTWFHAGDIQFHIGVEAAGGGSASKRHVCFEVADLAAMRTRLESAGYVIEEATPIDGLNRFFTRDPAGNKLELAEPC